MGRTGPVFLRTPHHSAPTRWGWDHFSSPVVPRGSMSCQICNCLKMWGSLLARGAMLPSRRPSGLGSEHAALQIVPVYSPCSSSAQKVTLHELMLGEGFLIDDVSLWYLENYCAGFPSLIVFFCFCILCRLSGPKLNSLQAQACEGT